MPAPRMVSLERRFEILEEDAQARGLTPKAWWLGSRVHEQALSAGLQGSPDTAVEGGRLVRLRGLAVKLLEESPDRLALWCQEGVLDLP